MRTYLTTMRSLIISSCLLAFVGHLVVALQDEQISSSEPHKCALRVIDAKSEKSVCVCNATYCDNFVHDWPTKSGQLLVIQSTKAGLRFDVSEANIASVSGQPIKQDATVLNVDLANERQSILGFGGAFTDAAGLNINSLPKHLKHKLMASYFGKHGSQYTFGRVVIGGADFSTRAYSYDDMPPNENDFNLTHWSLSPEDHKYKIPLIKEAQKLVERHNSKLKLFGSSWSPPAFMKTSKSLVRGHLLDQDQVYRSYAQYLINFYNAYKSHGIEFWGGTVQNEPVTSDWLGYNFNSLQLGADQAVKFVGKYLGPALVANGYTKSNFKLMINDDNIDTILDQAPKILADEDARKYVAGLAFHWYNSGRVPYEVINKCYDQIKDYVEFVLMTEACIEPGNQKPVDLGSWERGERYANDIIEDLRRHSGGWVDWNLALDEQGAPNWVHNFVDAAVIVNKDKGEFYKQPMYYVLAQFSRFFRPGSVVVDLVPSEGSNDDELKAVAVHKKDTGHLVVNALNKSENDKSLLIKVLGVTIDVVVRGKSMNTYVVKL